MASPKIEVKHIACARCRERKVKCDGQKPTCRRCTKNKMPCQYVRGKKQVMNNEWTRYSKTFSSNPTTAKTVNGPKVTFPQPVQTQTQTQYRIPPSQQYPSDPALWSPSQLQTSLPYGVKDDASEAFSRDYTLSNLPSWTLSANPAPLESSTSFLDPYPSSTSTSPIFCNTGYTPNFVGPDMQMPVFGANKTSRSPRPYTPNSQTSEGSASFEEMADRNFNYAGGTCYLSPQSLRTMSGDWEEHQCFPSSPVYSAPPAYNGSLMY